jgi:hypothetical protein
MPMSARVGIAHGMKQRQSRAVAQTFLRTRTGEHFSEKTHDSSPWLVLPESQYRQIMTIVQCSICISAMLRKLF